MRRAAIALACLLSGCIADIRPAIHYTDGHAKAVQRVAQRETARAVPESREAERWATVHWHAHRSRNWTKAMLRHKGPPRMPLEVPQARADEREVRVEDMELGTYETDIETEKKIVAAGKGLLGKALGIGGAGGTGLIALFMGYRRKIMGLLKQKDRALDEYDEGIEKAIPDEERRKIKLGVAALAEHAARNEERKRLNHEG